MANSPIIHTNGVSTPIGPSEDSARAHLESLVRADYERSHPGDSFEALKQRARFSKEDKGSLREWMTLATHRAADTGALRDAA